MKIGGAPGAARTASDEIVTGLWQFAHAQGLLTNNIGERTVNAGVTIDQARVIDGALELQDLAGSASFAIRTAVASDAVHRFNLSAAGALSWGPGNGALDASLFRDAVGSVTFNARVIFTHILGVLADLINEETVGAGVTIEGVRLRDTAVDLLGRASSANRVLGSDVIGDVEERFRLHAGGIMQWGDGANPRDVELRRDAANELGTPDDLNVGGTLDLGSDVEVSEDTTVVVASPQDDFATGTSTVRRVSTTVILTITGLAGGRQGRLLLFTKFAPIADITFTHEDVGSVAANRIRTPTSAGFTLSGNNAVWFWYDTTLSRWILVAPST